MSGPLERGNMRRPLPTAVPAARKVGQMAFLWAWATAALLLAACGVEVEPEAESLRVQESAIDLVDTWASKAARIQQRDLQMNVPLDRWQRIGSHNSHVSTTYTKCGDGPCYYSSANQHRTVEGQLKMGVRTLMLDVWSGGGCQHGWSVCFSHEGEVFGQHSVAILDEIAFWINHSDNKDEVLILLLEDKFDTTNTVSHKRQFFNELLYRLDKEYWPGSGTPVEVTSGDLIFRPKDKDSYFTSRWPTPRELVTSGKRVLIAVKDRSQYDIQLDSTGGNMKEWFFDAVELGAYSLSYPSWPKNYSTHFDSSRCGSHDIKDGTGAVQPMSHRFTQFEERQMCDHFETCLSTAPLSERIDVAAVSNCGFSVAMDQVEADPAYTGAWGYDYYSRSMKKAIWTFDEHEPNDKDGNEDCAEILGNGRWNDMPCTTSMRFVCKKIGATCDPSSCPSDFWTLSASPGSWPAGITSCPQGYEFSVPRNGYENKKLRERANGERVWLNFTDLRQEGRWEMGRFMAWAAGEPNNYANEDCLKMRADGAWNDVACSSSLHQLLACRRPGAFCGPSGCTSSGIWAVKEGICPPGYTVSTPRNPYENAALKTVAEGRVVRLGLTDAQEEGFWELSTYEGY